MEQVVDIIDNKNPIYKYLKSYTWKKVGKILTNYDFLELWYHAKQTYHIRTLLMSSQLYHFLKFDVTRGERFTPHDAWSA